MAELVDAWDLKSHGPKARPGSTPGGATNSKMLIMLKKLERYKSSKSFTINEVYRMIEDHPKAPFIKIKKQTIPLSDAKMFFEKGLHCHECGISGQEFRLAADINKKNQLDLFSSDTNRLIILDLIIPKKYHGIEQEFNLIPVCSECYTRLHDKVKVDWITPELIEWVNLTFGMNYLNKIIDDNTVSVETEDFD